MSFIDLVENNDIDGIRNFLLNEINKSVALTLASRYGYTEIVILLLKVETINVNLQNNNGGTALMWASEKGYVEIVKLLLKVESINVNLQNEYGNTALIIASKKENIEIVKLLLENETIDVNLQNNRGRVALIIASWNEHIEIIKLLLEVENINVNIQNEYGRTTLMYASDSEHIEIVKLLLSKGAIVPSNASYSKKINNVLTNWKTYLPKWNRFKTYKYYPKEFKEITIQWLLICKRKNFVSKDIKLLMIEYFAESWKLILKV